MSHVPRPGSALPPDERNKLAAWIIGGAAALVALTGVGILLFGGRSDVDGAPANEGEPATDIEMAAPAGTVELAPHPLDTTKSQIDAVQRAKAWNPDAQLARIQVRVKGGSPQGAIRYEFGEPQGALGPGAPLASEGLILEYRGTEADEERARLNGNTALPEPNCPLEVAWRKAVDLGVSEDAEVMMTYVQSNKHRRPVWVVQEPNKGTHVIDGASCVVLAK